MKTVHILNPHLGHSFELDCSPGQAGSSAAANAFAANTLAVNSIFGIGRNYVAHIAELGNQAEQEPIVFLKPNSSLLQEGQDIVLPGFSQDVHFETELVLLIGQTAKNIAPEDAWRCIAGYGIGLDLTARDLQAQAKARGLPWALAKGFDGAACVSHFVPALPNPAQTWFEMHCNGTLRQRGDTALMLFTIPQIIAYLSSRFSLCPGDLVFTGTPEGVGPLHPGDVLELNLAGLVHARFAVARP